MAEPFVFRFAPGEHGEPEVMYVADVRCECGLCGHVQMQRFYHSTPFHPLTLDGLVVLARRVHRAAGYDCENCGEHVGAEHVSDAALTYGCPDDAGLIRIFIEQPNDAEPKLIYELVADRRLDPQALPGWAPSTERGVVYTKLTEELVERELGRAFNPKLLWIELFDDWQADPDGGAYAKAAPGYWLVLDGDEDLASDLAADIEDDQFRRAYDDGDLMVIALVDSVPAQLATHSYPSRCPGAGSPGCPTRRVHCSRMEMPGQKPTFLATGSSRR